MTVIAPTGATAASVAPAVADSQGLEKIAAEAIGKTITVKLPKEGSFAVYDKEGEYPLNYSIVSGNNKVTLPKSGTMVFTGAPGSEFQVTIK
ncbi:hypothetical protein [Brevibacillus sp. DP1.3A]|uniref:hypothetical protein n=1 Tax=Brevibacillus sp. DP1.3A TaxID=2738867 RepID=UPI00156AFADC